MNKTQLLNYQIPNPPVDRILPKWRESQIIAKNPSELVMKIMFSEGSADLTVPDTDVTESISGSLRRYDIHVARMFEVTDYFCTQGMVSPGIDWSYYAGDGKIDMGTFSISCKLAAQIVEAYKVRKPRPTTIFFSREEAGPPITNEYPIPMLDLEHDANKTRRWVNFTRNFKPVRK